MKYRLDSVRKNKARFRRRFLSTPAKKKTPVRRKKKVNWVIPILFCLCTLSLLVSAYVYTKPIEYRTIIQHAQPTIPLIPPLPPPLSKSVPIKKEVKRKKPKVIDLSNCYPARRGATVYTECNWK